VATWRGGDLPHCPLRAKAFAAGGFSDHLYPLEVVVITHVQGVVEPIKHIDEADEKGEFDEFRVCEHLVQSFVEFARDAIRIVADGEGILESELFAR